MLTLYLLQGTLTTVFIQLCSIKSAILYFDRSLGAKITHWIALTLGNSHRSGFLRYCHSLLSLLVIALIWIRIVTIYNSLIEFKFIYFSTLSNCLLLVFQINMLLFLNRIFNIGFLVILIAY